MHRLLTEHPKYREALRRAEKVRTANARFQARTTQEEQEFRLARTRYEAEAKAALERNDPLPERPVAPEVDAALAQQLASDAVDAPRFEHEARAELCDEVLPRLEARAAEVEATFADALGVLGPLAREASELRVTAAQLRAAAGLPPLREQGAVGVAAMFVLVEHGDRLLQAGSSAPAGGDAAALDVTAPRGSHQPRSLSNFRLAGRR